MAVHCAEVDQTWVARSSQPVNRMVKHGISGYQFTPPCRICEALRVLSSMAKVEEEEIDVSEDGCPSSIFFDCHALVHQKLVKLNTF